ncbi:MAG: hypothetical protein M5T52_04190 [Ignavibacteriaceae bacterium]|nr:hypothetical protein [Ignavibacteriaceae bacterium]
MKKLLTKLKEVLRSMPLRRKWITILIYKPLNLGLQPKRSGWDCLRHYEIAANGAVMCFKDLHKKPTTCAPHGLIPGINCISYTSYDNLLGQISNITDTKYDELQQASLVWVKDNTTVLRAKRFLSSFKLIND